jgi:hypothetical protein
MEVTHDQKHGNSKQEERHHVREQDERSVEVPPPESEPCEAVGRRRSKEESERGRDNPDQKAIQKIGEKRGILKEVPIMVKNDRAGEDPRRMPDDLVIRLQGAEESPDQWSEDKQGDQGSDHVGDNGLKLFVHSEVLSSAVSQLNLYNDLKVLYQQGVYNFVIPDLIRNPVLLIWIPAGVYPVLDTGQE